METIELPEHLAKWMTLELQQLPFYKQSEVALCPSNYCFANSLILSSLNPQCFTGEKPIIFEIKDYLSRQFHIHFSLKLCNECSDAKITILTIYICLHSENKNSYISRIISKLSDEWQQNIMKDMQKLEEGFQILMEGEHFWKNIAELEDENQKIVKQLKCLEEKYRESELDKLEAIHQRDQIVVQKRKILSKFKLSNMAEYQELCQQLQIQNEESYQNFKRIESIIKHLSQQKYQLETLLKQRENTFYQLTNDFNQLKNHYNQCRFELEQYQTNLSGDIDTMCTKMFSNMESTDDETIQQTIRQAKNLQNYKPTDSFTASSSGFSFSKSSSMGTTQSIFKMTKNNLILCEKLQNSEEQIEQLKQRIYFMEDELKELQTLHKEKLLKLRRIQKIFDPFWEKCQQISKQAFQ